MRGPILDPVHIGKNLPRAGIFYHRQQLFLAKRFLCMGENLFVGPELIIAVMSSCWSTRQRISKVNNRS
jgi:hypothetical protein